MKTYGRKVNRKSAIELYSTLDGLNELWYIRMAWVEPRSSIDNTNYRSRKCILSISRRLDEDLPEEQGEMGIALQLLVCSDSGYPVQVI